MKSENLLTLSPDGPGPKLREMIRLHDEHKRYTVVPDNFGDGFLCASNPIYRNIRDVHLHCGMGFSEIDYCFYDVFPLAALKQVLITGKIPHKDNVTPLREIEKVVPDTFGMRELPALYANHLFHEAAHCISGRHPYLAEIHTPDSNLTEKDRVLKTIISESFANTCEQVACGYVTSEFHRFFLNQNSYFRYELSASSLLHSTIEKIGFRPSFELIFVSFLFANFMYADVSQTGWETIERVTSLNRILKTPENNLQLRSIFSLGFTLNKKFRKHTASFYFRYHGFTKPLKELLDFDFLEAIYENDEARSAVEDLFDLAENGLASKRLSALKPFA